MIENKRIIIVAHYLLYGAAHALADYLLKKNIESMSCVFLPLASQRKLFLSEYRRGNEAQLKRVENRIISREFQFGVVDYLLDIIQTLWFVFSKKKFDTYIGFDALNCLSGLFLKKFRRVNKVIFYSIDFVPLRFHNKLLNFVYHQIEIFCVKSSDQIWNVSPRIAEGRKKFLHLSTKQYKQKVVPIGVWNENIKKRPFSKIKKHQILFLGHLLEKQGVQIVLEALPLVIKKLVDARFIIAGGGEYLSELQEKVKKLSLGQYVTFTGWIKERKKIDEMMSESAIAVATYKPEKKQLYNFTYYADPTKLKDYLSAGLPIILTNISYNSREIAKKKCGILVKYDKVAVAKAIIELLKNEKTLSQYRKNALKYSKQFNWNNVFDKVIIGI